MQLRLVEESTAGPAAQSVRKARRRSSLTPDAAAVAAEVPVSGAVECDRSYGLVLKCEVLADDGVLCVRHAAEVPSDGMDDSDDVGQSVKRQVATRSKAHKGTRKGWDDEGEAGEEEEESEFKRSKRGRATKSKKKSDEEEEEEESEELRVVEEDEEEEEGEDQPKVQGKSKKSKGTEQTEQTRIYVVWQLWTNPEGSEGEEESEGKRKKKNEEANHRNSKRRKSEAQPKSKKGKVVVIDNDEGDSDKEEQDEDEIQSQPEAAVALKILPAEAANLKLISHDRAKGEARFALTLSSAFFDSSSSSSPLTRLVFAASARMRTLPIIPSHSTASRGTDHRHRQFDAFLPLTVRSGVGLESIATSSSRSSARLPSPVALPPIVLPSSDEASSAASLSASSLPPSASLPFSLPPLPPSSSVPPPLPPTLLPPLRNVPLPFPLPSGFPLPSHPVAANGASAGNSTAGRDRDRESGAGAWADFTSTVKAATLKSLQKGKEPAESKQAASSDAAQSDAIEPATQQSSSRRAKRRNRHESEILIEKSTGDVPLGKAKAEPASSSSAQPLAQVWDLRQSGGSQREASPPQQPEKAPSQEGLRKWYDEQNVRTRSSEILQFLHHANKRVDPKFLERFTALHSKLFPVFEQFTNPDTQHTLILILLHALTLTGYCVDLIRFCYWVKDFASLSVEKVVDQATELSSQLVQLQFQKEVEEKLHGCLTALLATLTSLTEIISGPVYESYQPEKEPTEKAGGKGKKFISLAKGNAVPWIKEWLKSSYAEVQGQSVAKKMVYKDYLAYCNRVGIEPTTSSVLGKIFREVFPFVSTRRLGSRNNNITYYSNIGPTSSLLAYSSASVQTTASSSSVSSPPGQQVMSPPSPPQPVAISPAATPTASRSRSSSTNSRNPSPPSSARDLPSSSSGVIPPNSSSPNGGSSSSASGERPAYHMGSFRSSSPNSAFSYYPSPSYYSAPASSSSTSSSGSRHATSSSSSSSGAHSASLKRSTSALHSSFASTSIRSNSPTPTSAFIPQPTSSSELGHQGSSGQYSLAGSMESSAVAPLPHYFTLPPIPPSSSSASHSSSSAASFPPNSSAAGSSQASTGPYPPSMLLPAALSILASFPHLLPAYASGLYPPSATGLPPGYHGYPYAGYPYPYPYPTDQQPTAAEAAAAAAAIAQLPLPGDPASAALLASQYPGLAFVKREQRDVDVEQQMKEAEVQQHAMALDSARSRRRERDEGDEISSSSPRTSRRHHHQDGQDTEPNESAEELSRNKRQRRSSTKSRN